MPNNLNYLGIIGEGKMGTNLFYYLGNYNFHLSWLVSEYASAEELQKSFRKKLDRSLKAGILTEENHHSLVENVNITQELNQLKDCELIIEAIPEHADLKKELFKQLDNIVNPDCIFISNSSSINPSELAPAGQRAGKFAGVHFFYPISLKNIVELIRSDFTSDKTVSLLSGFLNRIDRNYLLLDEKNSFILNRIFLDFQNEAWLIVQEANATIRQIDELVKKEFFPIGVFEFFDSVGNDTMLASLINYTRDYANRVCYSSLINELSLLVSAGRLGQKTGNGFYIAGDESGTNGSLESMTPGTYRKIVARLKISLKSSVNRFTLSSGLDRNKLLQALTEYFGEDKFLAYL